MANKMAEVAKLLGVELNEVFDVDDGFRGEMDKTVTCRLTEKGLQTYVIRTGTWVGDSILLSGLLCEGDRFTIVKKPWIPKIKERYWSYSRTDFHIEKTGWYGWPYELALFKCGAIFRTEEEAIEARPRIYEELTGKKWSDT